MRQRHIMIMDNVDELLNTVGGLEMSDAEDFPDYLDMLKKNAEEWWYDEGFELEIHCEAQLIERLWPDWCKFVEETLR